MTDTSMTAYPIDGDVVRAAMNKRGWDVSLTATASGVHRNTIKRIIGEYSPPSMKSGRYHMARRSTVFLIADALRIPSEDIAPECPVRPARVRQRGPAPPPHKLAKWRHPSQKGDVVHRRLELAAEALEQEQ